jgi:hypothetical protein
MSKTSSSKIICPVCHRTENVHVFDQGFKFFFRLFRNNNRLACTKCKTSWREKEPGKIAKLREGSFL